MVAQVAFLADPNGGGEWIVLDGDVIVYRSVNEQDAVDYVETVDS